MSEETDRLEARIAALEAQVMSLSEDKGEGEGEYCAHEMDGGEDWIPTAGGGSGGMFAWDGEKMGPGGALVGRNWVEATGTGEKEDGEYWLKVTLSANGATAEVVNSSSVSGDAECVIPIYTIEDGAIKVDRRGAFVVQCWE